MAVRAEFGPAAPRQRRQPEIRWRARPAQLRGSTAVLGRGEGGGTEPTAPHPRARMPPSAGTTRVPGRGRSRCQTSELRKVPGAPWGAVTGTGVIGLGGDIPPQVPPEWMGWRWQCGAGERVWGHRDTGGHPWGQGGTQGKQVALLGVLGGDRDQAGVAFGGSKGLCQASPGSKSRRGASWGGGRVHVGRLGVSGGRVGHLGASHGGDVPWAEPEPHEEPQRPRPRGRPS